MIILYIDTANNKRTVVSLMYGDTKETLTQELNPREGQAVLPLIDTLLKKHDVDLSQLTGIEVELGPGSFTGLRVGIAIANTLAKELNLPINGGKPGASVEPVYT